jgi:hypothetical protein
MQSWARSILVVVVVGTATLRSAVGLADKPIRSMRVNGEVASDVGDNCRYVATVHGTIMPVQDSSAKGKAPPVGEPNVDVTATVQCPNAQALRISDKVIATGPLTEEQLARALERRATLVMVGARGRCVYVPNLTVAGGDVKLRGVAHDCQ